MKRANVKRLEAFSAAQIRLRLLMSALHDSAPAVENDDLESLDFTTTAAEPDAGEEAGEAETAPADASKDQ